MNSRRSTTIIIGMLLLGITGFSRCLPGGEKKNPVYEDFIADSQCQSCHRDVYDQHLQTAHYASSAIADTSNIDGSFVPGENEFRYSPGLSVRMEMNEGKLFQNFYNDGNKAGGKSIDITIGSGTKGHSFLSWSADKLVQLPITYFTPRKAWATSPGFNMNRPEFNRIASSRCLECHITFAEKTGEPSPHIETYDSSKMIFRISCQRCHGAGKVHADYHTQNPNDKKAKYIFKTSQMDRERQLDLCGLCHNGAMEKLQPSFTYSAGEPLSQYFKMVNPIEGADIDVHGNQLGLLSQSKCFTIGKVTCQSCHDPHKKERGDLATFSNRCMNCHGGNAHLNCTFKDISETVKKQNCIDCHMPKQMSRSVAVMLQGEEFPTPALLRNHFIKVYAGESESIKAFIKEQENAK